MEGTALPVCFAVPDAPQAPTKPDHGRHQLHGADDLLSLYNLKPLWERSVKQYMGSARSKQRAGAINQAEESKNESGPILTEQGSKIGDESVASAAGDGKPLVMEKTYLNYVKDLPGES